MPRWRKITRGTLTLRGQQYRYGDVFSADEEELPEIVKRHHVEKVEPPKRTRTAAPATPSNEEGAGGRTAE